MAMQRLASGAAERGLGLARAGPGLGSRRPLRRRRRPGDRDRSRGGRRRGGALEAAYKGRLPELDGDGLAGDARALRGAGGPDRPGDLLCPAALRRRPRRSRGRPLLPGRPGADHRDLHASCCSSRWRSTSSRTSRSPRRSRARDGCAAFRPWLRHVRSYPPAPAADEVERALHEKHVTGRGAWVRLFDETMAALRFPLDGKELTSAEIFDLLSAKDRAVRERRRGARSAACWSRTSGCSRASPTRWPRTSRSRTAGASSSGRSPRAISPTRSRTRWSTR